MINAANATVLEHTWTSRKFLLSLVDSQDPYEALDRVFELCSESAGKVPSSNKKSEETLLTPKDKLIQSQLPQDLAICHFRLVPLEEDSLTEA